MAYRIQVDSKPGLPTLDCTPPFDVNEHAPAVNFAAIGTVKSLLHTALLLKLDESVASGLALSSIVRVVKRERIVRVEKNEIVVGGEKSGAGDWQGTCLS
jgi:hypothetical protein